LGALWEELEDVVDLLSETTRQHLIGLIEDKELDLVGLEGASLDHIVDTAWSTDNDVDTILEDLDIITDDSSTNAGVALDVHEVSDGNNDLLDLLSQLTGWGQDKSLALLDRKIDLLENGDGESGGLSGTGLGLSDNITVLDDWDDGTLLNSGWTLETVGVDTTEKLWLQIHSIEVVNGLIVVGVDLLTFDILESLISHIGQKVFSKRKKRLSM
jgi:hypothetical protein